MNKAVDAAALPVRDVWLHDELCAGRPVRAVLVEDIEKAEAVPVMRWNPVTPETLPPEGRSVLVCVDGERGNVKFESAYLFAEWYAKSGWWFDDWPELDGANVKWWMDICDVPEEKGGDLRCRSGLT